MRVGSGLKVQLLQVQRPRVALPRITRRSRPLSTPPSAPPARPSRFQHYLPRLHALSSRTGVPLPSLLLSFAVLHELTALVPLGALFWAFSAVGVGGGIVEWTAGHAVDAKSEGDGSENEDAGWFKRLAGEWLREGEQRVDRVARRYGLFGHSKGEKRSVLEGGRETDAVETAHDVAAAAAHEADDAAVQGRASSGAAAGVANALAAYLVVKALLPVRLGASLALSPAFSRGILEPTRKVIWHGLLRRPRSGALP